MTIEVQGALWFFGFCLLCFVAPNFVKGTFVLLFKMLVGFGIGFWIGMGGLTKLLSKFK